MSEIPIFDVLFLIARPAAGKSEIIHYLKQMDPDERLRRFHLGNLVEIDDFPMLWIWFEEDAILEKMGLPRLHTTPDGYFKETYLWNLLIERINLEYSKRQRDQQEIGGHQTTLVEFSRGKEHGGYRSAFQYVSRELASRAVILYLRVSYQESLRKNRRRFNPDRPDSILEHGLSDEKLERLYRETDWEELTAGSSGYLSIQGCQVPYATFENEDDVTTHPGEELGNRLANSLATLWDLYRFR